MNDPLSLQSAAALLALSQSPSPKLGPRQRSAAAATAASRLLMGLSSSPPSGPAAAAVPRQAAPKPRRAPPTPTTPASPAAQPASGSLDSTCRRVVDQLSLMGAAPFSAAELADAIGESRRRVYDILHVLEGVGVVLRDSSKRYAHRGVNAIPASLAAVRAEVAAARQAARARAGGAHAPAAAVRALTEDALMTAPADGPGAPARKQQRLLHVTRRFLQLCMLDASAPELSLKAAGARIRVDAPPGSTPDGSASGKNRSGVGRRLYDVVAVLVALGIVRAHKSKKEKSVVVNPAVFDHAATGADFSRFVQSAAVAQPRARNAPPSPPAEKRRRDASQSQSQQQQHKSPRTRSRESPERVPDLDLPPASPVPMAVDSPSLALAPSPVPMGMPVVSLAPVALPRGLAPSPVPARCDSPATAAILMAAPGWSGAADVGMTDAPPLLAGGA